MHLNRKTAPGAAWLLLVVSGTFSWAGCAKTAAPLPGDESLARQTLEQTLQAWRNGEKIDAMQNASPAIVVQDRKWLQGDRLTKYEVVGPGLAWAAARKFHVKLWLTNAKGKEIKDEANYAVETSPVYTVFRVVLE